MKTLLNELAAATTIADKSFVLLQISNYINKNQVNDQQIWSVVEPLLATPQLRSACFDVMLSIASKNIDLLRLVFFKIISNPDFDQHIIVLLQILKELTQNGKDITHLEHFIGPLICRWFESGFDLKKIPLISFASNLVKFSFVNLDLEHICCISKHILLCDKPVDVLNYLDTLIRYGQIPDLVFDDCIRKICKLAELNDTWPIIRNILGSHRSFAAIQVLYAILSPEPPKEIDEQEAIGAISLLYKIHQEDMCKLDYWVTIQAMFPCLSCNSEKITDAVLSTIRSSSNFMECELYCKLLSALNVYTPKTETLIQVLTDSFDILSPSSQHLFLTSCLKLSIKPETAIFVLNQLDSFLPLCENTDQIVELLFSSLYSKEQPIIVRSQVLQIISSPYMNLKTCHRMLRKTLMSEDDQTCFVQALDWMVKNVVDIDKTILVLLQLIVGTNGNVIEFWQDSIKTHKSVKSVAAVPDAKPHSFCSDAVDALLELFLICSSDYPQDSVVVFSWICRIGCWIEAVDSKCREKCLEFCLSLTNNDVGQISVTRHTMTVHTNIYSIKLDDDMENEVLNCTDYVYCIITILSFEVSTSVLNLLLEKLPLQLKYPLFWKHGQRLEQLRACLCKMINKEMVGSCLASSSRKSDLYAGYYRILLHLLTYRQCFTKKHQDEFITTFYFGLGRWPSAGKACMDGLTLSLYEIPGSILKHVPGILLKISQLTSQTMAIGNLEFLSSLARLPNLYVNFTDTDYKRALGIALYYLRNYSAQDQNPTATYIVHLGFHVLTVWFLSLKLVERVNYVPFIIQHFKEPLDESFELVLDMMIQNTFSDCWPKPPNYRLALTKKSWLQGNCIISIGIKDHFQQQIVIRRPTGLVVIEGTLLNPIDSRHKDSKEKHELSRKKSLNQIPFLPIDPSFLMGQFLPFPAQDTRPLPTEDAISRAISVLDRTPVTELHKIGIVFVGKNQKTEQEILSNTHGSRTYSEFLLDIGTVFRLQNSVIYTGGLDTSSDNDGKFALAHIFDQRMEQIIFHTTTLMPNSDDIQMSSKKRHVGNNYVTIVWNESGSAYNFDTIPGQFNFVVICIEPVSLKDTLYHVTTMVNPTLPEPMPRVDLLCRQESLGKFTRQLAIHCNMYCQIAAGKYVSNAKERLMQIKRLKSRLPAVSHGLDFTKIL